MPKTAAFANSFLKLIFQGTSIPNLADNAAASPATQLFLSLHTADPGTSGTQLSSEITYTGYARVALVRSASGWTINGNAVSPQSTVNFPLGTGGSGTATFVGIGTAQTGAGSLLYSGALTPSITCGNGVTPQFTPASTITET